MLKIIGISMLVAFSGGMVFVFAREMGLWKSLLYFGAAFVLVAWLYVAVYLITVKI